MKIYICELQGTDKKPKVCIDFPSFAEELKALPECTFYFNKKGERKGYCNQCGICCKTPHIVPPGYTEKFTDKPCPYLKEVVSGN